MNLDDMKWWQRTIAYEAYPKSFLDTAGQGTGTIRGIASRLDHLASLGVGALWLTPVYRSPMVDNGYDVQDYYAIDPSFGTMDDMDELISRARERGIRIVMDLVFNHTSDRCEWFEASRAARDGEKADWYIWRDAHDGHAPTNWRSIFGGSAWEWCEERQQYYLHTFAAAQPDLNWESPEVRQALYDVANFWADKGVGGFRVDAITYIKKPAVFSDGAPDAEDGMASIHEATANTDGILDFLNEFKEQVVAGRDIFTVAEANGVGTSELPLWVGSGGVFDMLFGFDHMHVPMGAAEQWCHAPSWRLTELKRALSGYQASTARGGWCPVFLENHDQPRSVSNLVPTGLAAGDRVARARMLATVLLTLRGTPFVYQGEELGYANVAWPSIDDYDDVSSRAQYEFALSEGLSKQDALECVHRFSRDNARTPMQWDASANAGFSSAMPWLPVHEGFETESVEAEAADEGSVLSWYRRLAQLRTDHVELVCGDYEELLPNDECILAFSRGGAHGDARVTATVLANFSAETTSYDPELVRCMSPLASTHGEGVAAGVLRPLEAVIFETDK